ncbi:MAG: GNAT family N-acetyltransferase [candidate division Zixibacteria bacterium]|nr:GNAT family N-acetyltransferase [candidate division Zixibacteria bacterium]
MYTFRVTSDVDECAELWKTLIPARQISDLWEVRECFHRHYNHRLHFIVCEAKGRVRGFLPLCYNEEVDVYQWFPGETWHGKTWLEQNRLVTTDVSMTRQMLSMIPGRFELRYLCEPDGTHAGRLAVDEISYTFGPAQYDFDINRYFEAFSHKSAKRLRRELEQFDARGVEVRLNEHDDLETMIAMNISRYGEDSYFFDPRFLRSFRSLTRLLKVRGWLRVTAMVIDGQVAAVDLGSVYNSHYTLLAGGVSRAFPGIAKYINVYHMNWACENHLASVDFLCGDFNWKTQFHLTAKPLYELTDEHDLRYHDTPTLVAQPSMTAIRPAGGARV